jgi:hypothetical protein
MADAVTALRVGSCDIALLAAHRSSSKRIHLDGGVHSSVTPRRGGVHSFVAEHHAERSSRWSKTHTDAAEQALQEATAELEALPNHSPLIITTALKIHQASATYRTNMVALAIFDLFELKREAQKLQ